MLKRLADQKNFPLLLFFFSFVLYISFSGYTSIYILDEAKNATCAREMSDNGDLYSPTFNNVLRTDKPPLHYFFMMMAYRVFGVNPFAARFFSAVFGALTILISFLFTKQILNSRSAFYTVVVLLSSIHLSIQFHLAVPDPILIFFFTASLFLFYQSVASNKALYPILMYVAMGFGTLSKGPVAILLPGLIFLLFLVFTRNFKWKTIWKLKPLLGIFIVLAVASPWYLLNGIQTEWEWTRGFFLKHNVNRFSGAMEGHGGIFLLTFLFVFLGLFPFSVYFPQVLRNAFKNKNNHFILFCLIAGLTVVGFFSVSQTKLPNYTVPAYPFLAVLFGYYLSNFGQSFRHLRMNYIVLLIIGILVPIGSFIAMGFDSSLASQNSYALFFVVLPIMLLLAFLYRQKLEKHFLFIGLSGIITALVFFGIVFPKLDKQNPVQQSLHLLENSKTVFFKKYNPSFSFYLKKEIPHIYVSDFEQFFKDHPNGTIISTKKKLKDIELPANCEIIFEGKDLFESPTTVIVGKKNN